MLMFIPSEEFCVGGTLRSSLELEAASLASHLKVVVLVIPSVCFNLSLDVSAIPLRSCLVVWTTSKPLWSMGTGHEFDPMLSVPAEPLPEPPAIQVSVQVDMLLMIYSDPKSPPIFDFATILLVDSFSFWLFTGSLPLTARSCELLLIWLGCR